MPALRPDALAGVSADVASEELAARLRGFGATVASHTSTADVALIDLRFPTAGEFPADVAAAGATAFEQLQRAYARRCPTVLCVLPGGGDASVASATLAAAVGSLVRSVAVEWAGDGVRVNCVVAAPHAPGLADVVAFLASPAAAMLTGEVVEVGHG